MFPAALRSSFDLVFAGHLHGGQFVLAQRGASLYPAAFFYPWNRLRHTEEQTTMLVSRGLHDTMPIRFNCPREVLTCSVKYD